MADHGISDAGFVEAVAKHLNLSPPLLPADILGRLKAESCEATVVLTGREPFDEAKWEKVLLQILVETSTSKPMGKVSSKQVLAESVLEVPNLIKMLGKNESNKELLYKSLLKILLLVLTDQKVLTGEVVQFLHTLQKEKRVFGISVQAVVTRLFRIYEEQTTIPQPKSFKYLPFQRAIPFFPDYGIHITIAFPNATLTKSVQKKCILLLQKMSGQCDKLNNPKEETVMDYNVGFDPKIWVQWLELFNLKPSRPVVDAVTETKPENNFLAKHRKLTQSEIHLWFFIKGTQQQYCDLLAKSVTEFCGKNKLSWILSSAYKKNDGKLFGGYFMDGISNAVDPMSLEREVLISGVSPQTGESNCEGGTFAFIQEFRFDIPIFSDSSIPVKENMIGRDGTYSETLANIEERAHIKRARKIRPEDGTNVEFLRQALPIVSSESHEEHGLFFAAFGMSIQRFTEIFQNMFGDPKSDFTQDLLLTHVQGHSGGFMYCPSADELQYVPAFTDGTIYPIIPFWMKFKSSNPLLFYNHIQYMYYMTTNQYAGLDPPSKRVLHLLSTTFQRWHSTWIHKFDVPRMPHLEKFLDEEELQSLDTWSIPYRKGLSYKIMLGSVLTSNNDSPAADGNVYGTSDHFGTFQINPKELIVGVTERLSFGSGKEVMPYLLDSELDLSWDLALTEFGNMGHVVPGHQYILELGVNGMLEKLKGKLTNTLLTDEQKEFYKSAILAFEGVQLYMLRYSSLACKTACNLDPKTTKAEDRINLREIAKRMTHLALEKPPYSFHDAVQLIFSMHCCLHLVGQAVSVGRLDQLLQPYYQRDLENNVITREKAQDIIDSFFIKFDEHVVLNAYNIPYGHTTYGSTCVTGRGGPFGTGDSLNQWIQQVTLGGYTHDGKDACNDITMMCLNACRRLPLNSPCVSLRLTPHTPLIYKEAAAKAILSGGAHPILYHDDRMVAGMLDALRQSFLKSNLAIPLDLEKVALDYCADGCYEPMFQGRTEFLFGYVFLLQAVMYTMNCGMNYQGAGPINLVGGAASYRSELPEEIKTFDCFKKIFLRHLRRLVQNLFSVILGSYGNSWKICPSPLLSCLIEGCVDSGRDMSNGGSRFHTITPMYVGFTNTVNSLYNVKEMVYGLNNTTSLKSFRMALINNWGVNMVEPFYDTVDVGVVQTEMWSQKYLAMREHALSLPKFGTPTANSEVNAIAEWLAENMNKIAYDVLYHSPLTEVYHGLQKKYHVQGKPFAFQILTGAGTFENYVSVGAGCGATPDGRLNGQPTASDCSPQPYAQDKPVPRTHLLDIVDSLKPYSERNLHLHIPGGCEVDLFIEEDFPMESLLEFIEAYVAGKTGSNLISITCVNKETLTNAENEPQKFDLVRNRMGGWSNFFVALFPEHKKQHLRRMYFGPHKDSQK